MEASNLNVENLCSRKLWEMLVEQQQATSPLYGQLMHNRLESELLKRRHYVAELQALKTGASHRRPTH